MSHLHVPLSILESALPKISSPVPPSQEFPRHRHTPWTAHSHFSVGWDCRNGLGWDFDPVPPCRDRDTSLCSSLEYFQGWGIKVDPLPLSQQLWDAPKGITSPFFPFLLGLQDFMDHCGFLILPEFLSNPAAVLGSMNPPSSSAETLLLLDLQILDGATIPQKILKKFLKTPK